MLDGRSSLDDIKEEFETQFTPQKITFHDLLQFVGMLHRSGLVISEVTGQGQQLVKRRDDKEVARADGQALATSLPCGFAASIPSGF